MADIGIVYHTKNILDGCNCCKELAVDDQVKLVLDGTNQLWPDHIVGVVYFVDKLSDGRTYKIKIDDEDLNGGPMPHSCNMEISCYSEIDSIRDEFITGETLDGEPSELFTAMRDAILNSPELLQLIQDQLP